MSKIKVENAIIMAAGLSSRFAPLSYERPKALVRVRGEILIERQIRQLLEAGISDIAVVVGYKAEMFSYLEGVYGVKLIFNPEYAVRNNHSTLYYARKKLGNTYICSADNYFTQNVFNAREDRGFYSAVYADGPTEEWCISANFDGRIEGVTIGGENAWIMLGHVFFTQEFSERFVQILEGIYEESATVPLLWEHIYLKHTDRLSLYVKKYGEGIITEFDTLEELRAFDESYMVRSGSKVLESIASGFGCGEGEIGRITPFKPNGEIIGFEFWRGSEPYIYISKSGEIISKK